MEFLEALRKVVRFGVWGLGRMVQSLGFTSRGLQVEDTGFRVRSFRRSGVQGSEGLAVDMEALEHG